ncbi:MAG: hypothetical protein GXY74_11675 [Phycisphaerae bacterium]|nr:hypothetical protein [Phycisphaerae bacterium]
MADKEIVRTLHQVRRRLAVVRAVENGLRWALYGAAAAILVVAASALAYSRLPSWYVYPYMPLALIPAALLLGAAARLLRPITLRDAAIYLDRQAGLHERVSTAYEFSREAVEPPLVAVVRSEALEICRRFRPGSIRYGHRVSWQMRYLAVGLLACGAMMFLPPYKTADYRAREAFDARSRKAAEDLRDSLRSIRQDRAIESDPALQELLKKAEEEADRLANARMAPARMLADMNRLKDGMKEEFQKRDSEEALAKAKEDAAKEAESVQAAMSQNPTEAESQKAEDLAKRVADGTADKAEKSALARVGKAAEQAGRASGDSSLEQAGKDLQSAAAGGQTSADQVAGDLSRIAKAAGSGKGQGPGSASRNQLKNAMDKVDQAKQAAGESGGQQQTASASQAGASGQGKCSACGGSGQKDGKPCSACNGTGQQQGGGGQCPSCGGTGEKDGQPCPDCNGTGQQGGGSQAGGASGSGASQPNMASTNLEGGGQGGHMELDENQAELPWARIYRPKSIEHTKTSEYSPGRIGKGESAGSILVKGPADPDETATMDFTGNLDAYRTEAMKALEDEHIPARQRELVRNYFLRRSQ